MRAIATKAGLETGGCSNLLTSLISLGIVKREYPITEKESSRKTLYRLCNNMFLFWYRFVRPNISAISRGSGEAVYYNYVKPQLTGFMGKIFEEMCIQYLFLPNIYDAAPFPIGNIGRWWGTNPKTRTQEEIDIVAVSENRVILGECKWRNAPVDTSVVQTLLERSNLLPYPKKYFYIFAKTGFTEGAYALGNQNGIRMISFKEMFPNE